MLRNLIIVLVLGLSASFASTASAQQAYTLKKVCNGRTCYYVRVPVASNNYVAPNVTRTYSTPTYSTPMATTYSYGTPVIEQTARTRPILGGTVVREKYVGSIPSVTTTIVQSLPTPTTVATPSVATVKVAEVEELELLNL